MDNIENNPKLQLAEKLKSANYIMVTVGRNPSVDQLASLIGLTLLLNKAGKHAAAVFSGAVPSTLEFLKPEDTIEKTTDSLRDFIIALDKSKADKLRYKVEDDVVRIFITPYKTSITQEDLEFSQGDFNVDVVVALGVINQEDLDEVIIAHGRILHDATVATVNISSEGDLGSIHWQNPKASSLSEMMTDLARLMGSDMLDNQIATALLTGIVAETERFSNAKTTADVMSASATLMAAGANQQLVASQLSAPASEPMPRDDSGADWNQPNQSDNSDNNGEQDNAVAELEVPKNDDGSIEIEHPEDAPEEPAAEVEKPAEDYFQLPSVDQAPPAETPVPEAAEDTGMATVERMSGGSKLITEPPTLGGQLTANSQVEVLEPSSDPLGARANSGQDTLLTRSAPMATTASMEAVTEPEPAPALEPIEPGLPELPQLQPMPQPEPGPAPAAAPQQMITGLTPPPPAWVTPQENPLDLPTEDDSTNQTLADLESVVHDTPASLDDARDEVTKALNSDASQPLEPVQALNAQPMVDNMHPTESTPTVVSPDLPAPLESNSAFADNMQQQIPSLPLPVSGPAPAADATAVEFNPAAFGITSEPGAAIPGAPATQLTDPNAAPPVPPPIPFNFGTPPPPPQA